jgi:NAD(P)-dependent dehydrogenase (short-subunit alcohol dehydrogenase family)
MDWSEIMTPDRIILITGSTDGVGRCLAGKLAEPGTHLLLHGRDMNRGEAVQAETELTGAKTTFFRADVTSLAEVRALANVVASAHPRLNVLVNNAGVAKPNDMRQVTPDGFELHFAVNYLAPFLLTHLLRGSLTAGAPARVINVVSAAQSRIDMDDLMLEHGYDGSLAYARSKLAMAMLTIDIAERWNSEGVTAACLHPGTHLDTTTVRQAGIKPFGSADDGANAVLKLVEAEAASINGKYFNVRREARVLAQAYDTQARHSLRKASFDLSNLEG